MNILERVDAKEESSCIGCILLRTKYCRGDFQEACMAIYTSGSIDSFIFVGDIDAKS